MTLQQLKYMMAVVEAKSINEASKKLFISQPTLTTSIQDLEKEVGIQLFHRSNKGMRLTLEGEEFLRYADRVIEQVGLMEEKYLYKTEQKVRFQISSQHYNFIECAFLELAGELADERYELALNERRTTAIIDDVRSGQSEFGFLCTSNINESVIMRAIKAFDLEYRVLYETTPHVFISTSHPLAGKDLLTKEDLTPYPFIYFDQGENQSVYFAEENLDLFPHPRTIRVTDRRACMSMLQKLNGFTSSIGIYTRRECRQIPMIYKKYDQEGVVRLILLTRKNTPISEIGQRYLNLLREVIKDSAF